MRCVIIVVVSFLILGTLKSQSSPNRVTHFYFENSLGSKDTLRIGLDQLAVLSDDCQFEDFGFMNYSNMPFETDIDIRHSSGFHYNNLTNEQCLSKSKVIDPGILVNYPNQYFDIHGVFYTSTDSITIRWDSTFFINNPEVEDSYLHFDLVNLNYPYSNVIFLSSRSEYTVAKSDIYWTYEQLFTDGFDRESYFFSVALSPDTLISSVYQVGRIDASIYPTVIKDHFTIESTDVVEVELYNSEGKKIELASLDGKLFSISRIISSGMYYLKIKNDKGVFDIRKLIKY